MKKVLSVVLLLVMSLCIFTGCNNANTVYDKELITNGDFEQTGTTLEGWKRSMAASNTADGVLLVAKHLDNQLDEFGESYLSITNGSTSGNSVYVYQEVEVEKKGIYKVSAYIKNTTISKGKDDTFKGAGVSVVEGTVLLAQVNTVGDWTQYTAYIKPKNTKTVTIALSLGAPENYTVGTACFENVSMVRVESAPKSAVVETIVKPYEKVYALSSVEGIMFIIILSLVSIGLVVGAYFAYRKLMLDNYSNKAFIKNSAVTATVLVAVGIALRLILAGTLFAKGNSVYLINIAKNIQRLGISAVYGSGKYNGYAPLYLYQLWIAGNIIKDWTSVGASSVIIRLVAIICDGVSIALIYFLGKKYVSDKMSAVIAALYALLPVTFVLSAGYNPCVPVLSMLLLIIFISIIEKKYIALLVSSLLAILWSPVALAIIPFVLMYEIYVLVKENNKKLYITFGVGWTVSFILFIVASIPVCLSSFKDGKIFNIFARYITMLFKSQICVSNAYNLYGLFGLNGTKVNTTAFWLNLAFVVILLVYTMSLYFKNRNRGELMLLASFFIIAVSVFSLNMNETSLAVGLALLLAYFAISGEIRIFWVFGGLAAFSFLNIGCVMNITGALGEIMKMTYFAQGSGFYGFCNVMVSLATLYFGWVVYDITANTKRKSITPLPVKYVKES